MLQKVFPMPQLPDARPVNGDAALALIEGLRLDFDEVVAVRDLSFRLERGSILGLVGPNGAGKTTALRSMAGILPPNAGRIEIVGVDLEKNPVEAKRRIAFVADDPRLFTGLTVWEHLRFTAALYRVNSFEQRARKLLEEFSLADECDTVCGNLSLGMRHKLGLCGALLHDPDVLMMDEPLTGLDPRGILTLKAMLKERAAAGKGVILSSHLLGLVEDICTHILMMHKGSLLYVGPLAGVREKFHAVESVTLEEVFLAVTEGEAASGGEGR